MKHTLGPWEVKRTHLASEDVWYVVTDSKGYGFGFDIGGKDKQGQIAEAKYCGMNPDQIQANAQLIAAAPDLLEACKDAWQTIQALHGSEGWDIYKNNAPEMKRLKKAIAKAEGEL